MQNLKLIKRFILLCLGAIISTAIGILVNAISNNSSSGFSLKLLFVEKNRWLWFFLIGLIISASVLEFLISKSGEKTTKNSDQKLSVSGSSIEKSPVAMSAGDMTQNHYYGQSDLEPV